MTESLLSVGISITRQLLTLQRGDSLSGPGPRARQKQALNDKETIKRLPDTDCPGPFRTGRLLIVSEICVVTSETTSESDRPPSVLSSEKTSRAKDVTTHPG